jgi:hypothetical protein
MAFTSGKNGTVTVGGNTLRTTGWRVSPKVEKLDVTNSASGGTGDYLAGVTDLDFEISFDYFVGNTPVHFSGTSSVPTGMTPGATISAVLNSGPPANNAYWYIPTGLVTDAEITSSVRGKVSCVVRGCASGGFTMPIT